MPGWYWWYKRHRALAPKPAEASPENDPTDPDDPDGTTVTTAKQPRRKKRGLVASIVALGKGFLSPRDHPEEGP
jgi:hypothetical protein